MTLFLASRWERRFQSNNTTRRDATINWIRMEEKRTQNCCVWHHQRRDGCWLAFCSVLRMLRCRFRYSFVRVCICARCSAQTVKCVDESFNTNFACVFVRRRDVDSRANAGQKTFCENIVARSFEFIYDYYSEICIGLKKKEENLLKFGTFLFCMNFVAFLDFFRGWNWILPLPCMLWFNKVLDLGSYLRVIQWGFVGNLLEKCL